MNKLKNFVTRLIEDVTDTPIGYLRSEYKCNYDIPELKEMIEHRKFSSEGIENNRFAETINSIKGNIEFARKMIIAEGLIFVVHKMQKGNMSQERYDAMINQVSNEIFKKLNIEE